MSLGISWDGGSVAVFFSIDVGWTKSMLDRGLEDGEHAAFHNTIFLVWYSGKGKGEIKTLP